ncbi:MAG: hypothetical protein V4731_17765 [Pseudomonadota bacterium]
MAEPATLPLLKAVHARRLRDIYRSAGWPCQDLIEVELLATGLVERCLGPGGHETLRVTDAGIACLSGALNRNRGALSRHEALVERVARDMVRAGRITWRGLGLRARLNAAADGQPARWCIARPDVFSIRNSSVETYLEPVVHEVKVSRADLLGDLRKPEKRAAYLDLGGECWYVLGYDQRGRPIADADEIPVECGVMFFDGQNLSVSRAAPKRPRQSLPLGVWLALAKATPLPGLVDDDQALLRDAANQDEQPGHPA